ncbi:MarR family winged helix-turn-helix transcriptional regulator [Paracraurococcus lichenis]|uniref:MarR family transcriptional regulator n=1 Tax=Paracraurococcus lichenis TaxID=3064888 RepID=A0ABT9E8M5_9PROT|nr:MarR family transcriptional regulator [Paracraurococcus sp. LOR1-02]MDO9712533.1 MarR family transcriptional regulator [Paracraurococcus sp. LOR1-02]
MPDPKPTEPRLDLDEFLCFAIHSTAQAVGRANKPMLDQIGLTYPQYLVMVVLWAEDNQTVGRIGDKLFLESNTLTPLLKRLQAAGYIERSRCPEDERQVRIRLTDKGRALQETARAHHLEWARRVFGEDLSAAKALKQQIVSLRNRLVESQN